MKEHVTVIPADQTIICNGIALLCQFSPHIKHMHALQWHNGKGQIEKNEDGFMSNMNIQSYETDVKPYVDIWQIQYDIKSATESIMKAANKAG